MKKLFALTLCAMAVVGCKTEIEKDVSLNTLLNDPIKTETALLNVEVSACGSHEDSRKPSDSLIKVQQKIPTVFTQAKYKECYQQNMTSYASFEIPIGVGVAPETGDIKDEISIYSFGDRKLNVRTQQALAKRIRDFVKSEYISNLEMIISLNVINDTQQDQVFSVLSSYVDGVPVSYFPKLPLKKGQKMNIRLSNVSADMLWKNTNQSLNYTTVLTSPFNINEISK
ncbi:DUF7424 family protein [Haemophilus sp. SZY H52]|uniref:DUF7424 family protein n=1 Tax=Haemophilus sp. SZY H52 TaxID=3042471 RepID=UPI0035128780